MADIAIKTAPDGTRYVRPYLGVDPYTGKPLRPYLGLPADASDAECQRIIDRWLMGIEGAARLGSTIRLGDLIERHVEYLESKGSPANTIRAYRDYARHAEPLYRMDVRKVGAADLERLYRHMLDDEGLSSSTVLGMHWFMSGFFEHLKRLGIIQANPAASAWHPSPSGHEASSLTDEQRDLLAMALDEEAFAECETSRDRNNRVIAFGSWLALNTGLRVGEVCGLRRRDVHPDAAMLHVSGTVIESLTKAPYRQPRTKGQRSRNVALSPRVLSGIRTHMAWSESTFKGGDRSPLVTLDGRSWLRPRTLSRGFRSICKRLGLPASVHFHTLRHTHATTLLEAGVDPKTVSERLGHADVSMTLRIYGHVLPGRDAEAARRFDSSLGKGGDEG